MEKVTKTIGTIVNDFEILDKIRTESGRLNYKVKCLICGDVRIIYNLSKSQTTHGKSITKLN